MGKMEREKGKRFERQLAGLLRAEGYDARRSAQFNGKTGQAADVVGLPGIHIEAKAQETMRLYDWMAQAIRDSSAAGKGDLPTVFHKKNNAPILVTMLFEDWIRIYREWAAGMELNRRESEKDARTEGGEEDDPVG